MLNDPSPEPSSPGGKLDWLPSTGEVAQLTRSRDWQHTAVGPIEDWPQSLKIVVRLMLTSRYAMWMGWGPELTFFYNDTYRRDTLGVKHPWALGTPAREVWAEIWPEVGPRVDRVLKSGEATWDEALRLILERSGYPEETYHTFSYSPISDDAGEVAGLLCVVTEETERVLGARRVAFLREVAAALAATHTETEVWAAFTRCVEADRQDVPFALVYLLDPEGEGANLAATLGISTPHSAAPASLPLAADGNVWPLQAALSAAAPVLVSDLRTRFGDLPAGPWDRCPEEAAIVPLAQQGQDHPAGFLVAALNPYRKLDADYQGFLTLLAGQIASGLANARAHEEERRRAEALAEIDRAKTAFFSNVSHEFRTPLTLMLGPVEEMLSQPNGMEPGNRELLTLIQRNALRLQKLVNSLLDFSRIEAGRVQASYQPVDLCATTAELVSMFRSAVEKAGLRLAIECEPPLREPVYVDRDMWEKIVLNLLSNAFKYTFEGEIRVAVQERDGHAEVAVQDTGIGIPEEDLPRLFERFHRVENARGRTHEGTGIGLALVQELVRLHGGNLSVESRVGCGTTFTVRLPLGKKHLPQERIGSPASAPPPVLASTFVDEALRWLPDGEGAPQSLEETAALPLVSGDGAPRERSRILLADDNADMRDYVQRLLAPHYQVEAVSDGLEALEAVRRQKPDLVISDVMMPGVDGFAFLQEVRADPRTRGLPVTLLSARAGEEARIEGLQAGADDYLTKPFGARELLARVESQLELARVRGEMQQTDAKLRAIFEQSPIGMYFVDTEMRLQQVNPKARPVFADLPDLIGRDFDTIMEAMWGRSVAEEIMGHFRHTLETGEPYYAPGFTSLRADRGVQEYYHWELARVTLPNGEAAGVLCTFFDVSEHVRARRLLEEVAAERERAKEELRLEAERLKRLARVALTINAAHSVDSVLGVITEEARELIGAHQAVTSLTVNDNWAQGIHAVSLSDRYAGWRSYQSPPDASGVYSLVCSENRPMRLTQEELEQHPAWEGFRSEAQAHPPMRGWLAVPLIGRNGKNLGLVQLSDKDDGEFSEADQAILTQLAQMAAIAVENARLYQDLRDQDRRKDEFLAMLAHELRNPLSPIRNALHLFKSPKATPAQREKVQAVIERQVDTLVRLVDDLMDVSRVTRGKVQLDRAPTPLPAVIHRAIETCQPLIDQQGHRLEVQLTEEPLLVDGDLTRLTQVVSNLLNNAAKYTEPGGRLCVRVTREGTQGVVRVGDNGIGIAPEMLARVFELFTQADRTLERAQGGLGIGLALSRKLVELHGGTLQGFSRGEGQGSEFVISLPLVQSKGAAGGQEEVTETPAQARGRRLLV